MSNVAGNKWRQFDFVKDRVQREKEGEREGGREGGREGWREGRTENKERGRERERGIGIDLWTDARFKLPQHSLSWIHTIPLPSYSITLCSLIIPHLY